MLQVTYTLPTLIHEQYILINALYLILHVQSNNEFNTAPHYIYKDSHANANTHPHLPHHKARYPSQVQTTCCCSVKGYIHSPSSHLNSIRHNFHLHHYHNPTASPPRGLRNLAWHQVKVLAVHAGESCVLLYWRARRHVTQCHAPTCANLFTVISSGHLLYFHYLHVPEHLCP